MSSKTVAKRNVKVSKCKHVFVQGPKKGKKCNKNCRESYCKDHNQKRKTKMQDKYKKQRDDNVADKLTTLINKIKNASSDEIRQMKPLVSYQMDLRNIECEGKKIIRKVQAMNIVLDKNGNDTYEKWVSTQKNRLNISNDPLKRECEKLYSIDDNKIIKMKEKLLKKAQHLKSKISTCKQICNVYEHKMEELRNKGYEEEDIIYQLDSLQKEEDETSDDISLNDDDFDDYYMECVLDDTSSCPDSLRLDLLFTDRTYFDGKYLEV